MPVITKLPATRLLAMSTTPSSGIVIATFATPDVAEEAVRDLGSLGFDLAHLSVVGRGFHAEEHGAGVVSEDDYRAFQDALGAFWSRLRGILTGRAFLLIPGEEALVVLGWFAGPIVETATVTSAGVAALGAALASLGLPSSSVLALVWALGADQIVLVARGTPSEAAEAHEFLLTKTETAAVFDGP